MANINPRMNSQGNRKGKAAKAGTPIRNGLLLLGFAGLLALLVVFLPKNPGRNTAIVLAPGAEGGEGILVAGPPLQISEVMASNHSAWPDDQGKYADWLEIENTSDAPVNLSGIGLSDREDRVLFLFPDVELAARDRVVVFCDDANQADKGRAFHARFKISAVGEILYLFDGNAQIIDVVQTPALNSDVSYSKIGNEWAVTEKCTPGYPNTEEGYAQLLQSMVGGADGLVINEVLASNRATIADEDGEYSDWIELYNGGALPVDLYNYVLSDDQTKLVKWRFPKGAVIAPGEYYLVFASGKNRPGNGGDIRPHTNFSLSAEGETIILSDILSQPVDRVTYENLAKDTSFGRVVGMEHSFQIMRAPTPGMANDRSSELEMDKRMRRANHTGVFISEVVTTSTGIETSYGKTSYDWVEIVNLSTEAVNLRNWGLSDNIGRPRKWQFPDIMIASGECMLVFTSGLQQSPTRSGALHADFRLSALGETLVLSDAEGHILDKLVVPKLETNTSYGRSFDRDGLFYYDTPTPGELNWGESFIGYALAPTIEQKGALLTRPTTVTIAVPSGTSVRYTLDGSEPTQTNGENYTGAIEISRAAVLRARGFAEGLKPSEIVTESYLINAYHILPVVSLTVDPKDLWDPLTGIYTFGLDEEELTSQRDFSNAVYRVIKKDRSLRERPGNFELFSPEGEQLINMGLATQLHGQFSLDLAQKSFRLSAKSKYGGSIIPYAFFEDRPFSQYQAIILRNGGNDGSYSRIVDALISKMVDWTDSEIIHMASTPVIAYLNGQYWGHYDIRERINTQSIAAYEGWPDADKIDLIKGNNQVIDGAYNDYGALIDYVKTHDLNDPEALQTVQNWVDIDNYFDYMIFEMYFANTDTLNIKFYRQQAPGAKWKWVFFDMDWAYFQRTNNGCSIWLDEKGSGERNGENVLIRKLLEVPEMRDKFLTRYGELFQILSDTDRTMALIDEMVEAIEPEMGLHFSRWAGETTKLVAFDPPVDPEAAFNYWGVRVDRVRNVARATPHLVWGYVQDWFKLSNAEMEGYFGSRPESFEF